MQSDCEERTLAADQCCKSQHNIHVFQHNALARERMFMKFVWSDGARRVHYTCAKLRLRTLVIDRNRNAYAYREFKQQLWCCRVENNSYLEMSRGRKEKLVGRTISNELSTNFVRHIINYGTVHS
uniref:Uncharacterized protein n=1 Tax=Sipha flava TaxID=143950 RepID=A0A2S2QAN2_9HEMI